MNDNKILNCPPPRSPEHPCCNEFCKFANSMMTSQEKVKLSTIEYGAQVNVIEEVLLADRVIEPVARKVNIPKELLVNNLNDVFATKTDVEDLVQDTFDEFNLPDRIDKEITRRDLAPRSDITILDNNLRNEIEKVENNSAKKEHNHNINEINNLQTTLNTFAKNDYVNNHFARKTELEEEKNIVAKEVNDIKTSISNLNTSLTNEINRVETTSAKKEHVHTIDQIENLNTTFSRKDYVDNVFVKNEDLNVKTENLGFAKVTQLNQLENKVIADYATKVQVNELNNQVNTLNVNSIKRGEINAMNAEITSIRTDLTSVKENYSTKSESQLLADEINKIKETTYTKADSDQVYAKKVDVNNIENNLNTVADNLNTLADNLNNLSESVDQIDLTPYITDSALETKLNDKKYLVSNDLKGYVTEEVLNQKGYLVNDSLVDYAKSFYVNEEISKVNTATNKKIEALIDNAPESLNTFGDVAAEFVALRNNAPEGLDTLGDIATRINQHEERFENHNNEYKLLVDKVDLKAEKAYVDSVLTNANLASKDFVSAEIAKAQLSGRDDEIDLSGYATKDDLNYKANIDHTHSEYAAVNHTHSDYATLSQLNQKANISHTHNEYLTSEEILFNGITTVKVGNLNAQTDITGWTVLQVLNKILGVNEQPDEPEDPEVKSKIYYGALNRNHSDSSPITETDILGLSVEDYIVDDSYILTPTSTEPYLTIAIPTSITLNSTSPLIVNNFTTKYPSKVISVSGIDYNVFVNFTALNAGNSYTFKLNLN